ncbi:hypothetical protein TraAM80_02864 [Trypanosoma rangeli]|uniref:Uncharacterized protein n=1 Tax=Trypanosoma rangeli TaxID=5698 RepID=A0A3R7NLX1_TRYRA|nr:uncharacterized protein TraAM80_02864 [Trypanosoma rangeli]RNF08403.1 hypothetical protein TraAM80_02864 [Trypanosoma rangeli]|eukprot:RNF08403.1 hypothetical protein TraAM80_02864 [Trypanosoma rangeli]
MPPWRNQKATGPSPTRAAKKTTSTTNRGKNKRAAVVARAQRAPVSMGLSKILGAHPLNVVENDTVITVPSPCDGKLSSFQRLATVVHGIFLVTLVTKAQLGVLHFEQGITATADDRWLESLVRYCGFTVLLNDIIETAAAFSDWLQVFVVLKQSGEALQNPLKAVGEATGLTSTVPKEIVVVRLKLLRVTVPSVSEAEVFLCKRWGQSEGWRRDAKSCLKFLLDGETTPTGHFFNNDARPVAGRPTSNVSPLANSDEDANDGGEVNDEELLAQISKELRASLSQEKLRCVVAQMRREVMGLDAKQQELVTRRQQREHLLATYDLVCVILGERRSVCNLAQLVPQMAAQNRFGDDEEKILQQLASLALYRESGIAMFSLDDALEKHLSSETEAGATSFTSKSVNVSKCTTQELESVVLCLDRHAASRAKLFTAVQQE